MNVGAVLCKASEALLTYGPENLTFPPPSKAGVHANSREANKQD